MAGAGRARAQAWPPGWIGLGRQGAASAWRHGRGVGAFLAERIRPWLAAETDVGRLFPWLPVAFGSGIVLYFAAGHEPSRAAALGLAAAAAVAVLLARRHAVAFPVLLAVAAASAGFATATVRNAIVAHPVLQRPLGSVQLSGFVETREERERTDRIVLRIHHIDAGRLDAPPDRVRLSIKRGTAPAVGAFVEMKARLSPPLQPLRPGGYDFARDLYFQGIGASGFALGAIRPAEAPAPPGLWLRYAAVIQGMRDGVDARIRAVLPGDAGSIASALITGKRDAISTPVNDAMYISSLAHVLSISGYHMAVVAGVVFFIIRAGLALIPAVASRYPIKKWAAIAALAASTFYLLLSGAEVATQRSYLMIAVVLVGVLADRPALTLRTLALSALAVLLLAPEAVVHPSFQMSFAATLALIALYGHGLPRLLPSTSTSLGARVALWGGREIVGLILASTVAGLATTPYAAYHFHRLAPYGVLANLLAMPIVSAWVMPTGMVALILMPFGLDGVMWKLMGSGIDWMDTVALWVASLPGAVGRMAAFGAGPLMLATAGLLVVCLLRTPLRWAGMALLLIATIWAVRTPQPDIYVAGDGQSFAVRTDGRLAVLRTGSDSFAAKDWLAADADPHTGKERELRAPFACDDAGCTVRLADGGIVAVALTAEAFEEDCRRAAVVLSPRTAPPDCATTVVDRNAWRQRGATTLRRNGTGFAVNIARPAGEERPWSPGLAGANASVAGTGGSSPASPDPTPPDEADSSD